MSARQQILEQFDALTPRMQAAARFIVDHPNEVVIASMRTVAEKAGAQPATLVRLAQQLGYAGWPRLKDAFAAELGLHSETYGQRAKSLAQRGRTQDLAHELFSVQRANLAATESSAGRQLREAARLLAGAQSVHIAGFRASHPVAFSLFYGLRLFRDSVFLVDGGAACLDTQLRPLSRRDALVVTSFAPYSREAVAVAAQGRKAGARLIALTDSSASPLALKAHATLHFAVASPSSFPSVAAGVALAEALLERLVADGGRPVARRIEAAERQLFESGVYVLPPRRRA
jgi:DNA-binding MurR/RpiR family transcriptional regulator